MSVGNTKTQGNQGKNTPFQFRNLQLLGAISASVAPPGGLATEATLQNVLVALQSEQEFEQNLVMDANNDTFLMVRIWNTVTHSFDPPVYYDANGAVAVPVAPIVLVNPQFVLQNILTEVTSIDASIDVALSTRATEATLLLAYAQLQAINADLDVALSTRASEATAASIDAEVTNLNTPVTGLPVNMVRAAAAGTVTAGKRSIAFFNAGGANATVAGAILKPGEQVSFSADGLRDVLAAVAYDATGTDLLITSVGA